VGNTHVFNCKPVPVFLQSLALVPAVIRRPAVGIDEEVTNDNVVSYVYEWLLAFICVREIRTLILAVVRAQCGKCADAFAIVIFNLRVIPALA